MESLPSPAADRAARSPALWSHLLVCASLILVAIVWVGMYPLFGRSINHKTGWLILVPALMLLSTIWAARRYREPSRGAVLGGVVHFGGVLASLIAVTWCFVTLLAYLPELCNPMGYLMVPVLNVIDVPARFSDGNLIFPAGGKSELCQLSAAKIGVYDFSVLLMLVFLVLLHGRFRARKMVLGLTVFSAVYLVGIVAAFLLAILCFDSLVFSPTTHESIIFYWTPYRFLRLALVGLATFTLLSPAYLRSTPDSAAESPQPKLAGRLRLVAVVLLMAGVGAVCVGVFHPLSGQFTQRKRVLIDDYHSGSWEASDKEISPDTFGATLYSYTALRSYLQQWFEVDLFTDKPITEVDLSPDDILIVKTPVKPFSEAEIDKIHRFVEDGGALLVIGDHTNLGGLAGNLNSLMEPYGLEFRYDSVNHLSDGRPSTFEADFFWRNSVLRSVQRVEFLTGCSMKINSLEWKPVCLLNDQMMDLLDYTKRSFFGDLKNRLEDDFGVVCYCVSRDYGKGNIVAFSDATVLSDFALFYDGHDELTKGFVEQLCRGGHPVNQWHGLRWLGVILIVLGLGVLLVMDLPVGALPLLLAGTVLLVLCLDSLWISSSDSPLAEESVDEVIVVKKHSVCSFPIPIGMVDPAKGLSYRGFLTHSLRWGIPHRVRFDVSEVSDQPAVFIINPVADFEPDEIETLQGYVDRGGTLFIIVDESIKEVRTHGEGLKLALGANDWDVWEDEIPEEIRDKISVSFADRGQGKVGYLRTRGLLSDEGIGNAMEEPDEEAAAVYRVINRMYETLIIPKTDKRLWTPVRNETEQETPR